MGMRKCAKCEQTYEQKIRTRSDPDKCPHCGWAHWDPSGQLNRDWKPPE